MTLVLLVARAQCGSAAALDALLRGHQQPLYRHIRAITRDPELALDVLQDTLLLIARRLPSLRDPRWFKAWAYRIATREAIRATSRQRWRDLVHEGADAIDAEATPAALDPALSRDEIEDRLARLSDASQIVLRLHYLEEMGFSEIAEALEIPVGTVKSRAAYGLAALRRDVSGEPHANPAPPHAVRPAVRLTLPCA